MSRSNKTKKPSRSQELRSVYYNLWQKDVEGFEVFEEYYDCKMEKLINHFNRML